MHIFLPFERMGLSFNECKAFSGVGYWVENAPKGLTYAWAEICPSPMGTYKNVPKALTEAKTCITTNV